MKLYLQLLTSIFIILFVRGFSFSTSPASMSNKYHCSKFGLTSTVLQERLSKKRRDQLGVGIDEDEYDLGVALETNTDPLITKIIAGSLIVVIIALLYVGLIVPLTTDYGDGVCNPALTAGRC